MPSPEFLARIRAVTAKRPRTVLEHILEHGHITTDELKQLYGYDHPPRAARDVREQGIPLKTMRVPGPNRRSIAAYVLDEEAEAEEGKAGGRRAFSKEFKVALLSRDGERCALHGGAFPGRALQIDHKVPYEVAGDTADERNPDEYMLVCASCNRAKAWSCQHCQNGLLIKDSDICNTCMWGSPESYTHIAMEQRRSLTLNWTGEETDQFDRLQREAFDADHEVEEYVKALITAKLGR